MKLIAHFDAFLRDTVNINQTRLNLLNDHTDALEKYVSEHESFEGLFVQGIPQGSWAHQTIIKPLPKRGFDADLLLEVTPHAEWSPKDYVDQLHKALLESGTYKPRAKKKTRCVRIEYAGECHVDLVPFIRSEGDAGGHIVNADDDALEPTNPEAFTAWFDEQNDNARGQLRRVVRLAKYLRDIKGTFTAKSVILTTLIASRVESLDEASFADTPTALRAIFDSLAHYLDGYPVTPPSVPDPSSPGSTFDHRWPEDNAVYQNFRECIRGYADKITAAYDEPNRDKSMDGWRSVFGEEFGEETKKSDAPALVEHKDIAVPGEKFLSDPEIGIDVRRPFSHSVKVRCTVLPKAGYRTGELRNFVKVGRRRELEFRVADCTVPEPYDVYWKIRNTGREAADRGELRGDIHHQRTRRESTAYRGDHFVECFIVKNQRCMAHSRYPVRVR